MRRWDGWRRLLHEAVDRGADLVEQAGDREADVVVRTVGLVESLAGPARAADLVRRWSVAPTFTAIHGINRLAEWLIDAGLDAAGFPEEPPDAIPEALPMRSDVAPSVMASDAAIGALNGTIGDHLHETHSALDLGMAIRHLGGFVAPEREALVEALPDASPRVAVFLHGVCTTEWSWCRDAERFHGDPGVNLGTMLRGDLGFTPLWVRYNTGRHVSHNGRRLAELLEALVGAWPVAIEELVLVGHSMGGLVVRSACFYAEEEKRAWLAFLSHVVCLGTPHRGAPLERIGHVATAVLDAVDLPAATIPAGLAKARSAGIKDLRYGYLLDEDWQGRDPDALFDDHRHEVPLLPGVTWTFVASTLGADPGHPAARMVGDLMVPVPSASGPECNDSPGPRVEVVHLGGLSHVELQNHVAVHALLRRILA